MTKIKLETPASAILSDGYLKTVDPVDSSLQIVEDYSGTDTALKLSTDTVGINGTLNVLSNNLINFSAAYQSGGSINITSANSDDLNGTVYAITGAFTIDIDDTVPDGFSLSIYQVDAAQCTVTASGTLTLRNRLGHTQTAGQYAVISVIRIGTDLILTGDTA